MHARLPVLPIGGGLTQLRGKGLVVTQKLSLLIELSHGDLGKPCSHVD